MKEFPKIPPKYKLLTTWRDQKWVIAVAESVKENKVILFRWDGVSEAYNEFWVFEKYEPSRA